MLEEIELSRERLPRRAAGSIKRKVGNLSRRWTGAAGVCFSK
jgi:hypothetical protein